MTPGTAAKRILSLIPPAVLCMLYGLWLFTNAPRHLLSALLAGCVLGLYIALYVRTVYDSANGLRKENLPGEKPLSRERHTGSRELLRLVTVLFFVRILTFVAAYGWSLVRNGYNGTVFSLQRVWANHPLAERYISLTNRGYSYIYNGEYVNLAVAPLYSMLVRIFNPSATGAIRTAFALSNINVVLSAVVLYELMLYEHDRRYARRAVLFFTVLPASFLTTCTVADSTFLLFSLVCYYLLRRRRFIGAAAFGALAVLTRYEGVALILPAVYEFLIYIRADREQKRHTRKIMEGVSLLLIPAAMAFMILVNFLVSGDGFMFVRQASGGYSFFFEQAAAATDMFADAFLSGEIASAAGFLPVVPAFAGLLLLLLFADGGIPVSARLYALGFILAVTGEGAGWPELLYCCFPVICACTVLGKRKRISIPLAAASTILLLLRLGHFVIMYGK